MNDAQGIIPSSDDELVRTVGRELLEKGLHQGLSLFTPDRQVWTPQTTRELHTCYNGRLDTGSDPFMVKLQRQLRPKRSGEEKQQLSLISNDDQLSLSIGGGHLSSASDEAIQLAAELLTLQGLPIRNLTAVTLRSRITTVLGWMRHPVVIPDHVVAAFTQGTWKGGAGAHVMLWKWLFDAVEFLSRWWSLPQDQRDRAFADPWIWQETIYQYKLVPSLREALLYLGFPNYFLPTINVDDKKAIRRAFADSATETTGDLNRDLFAITTRIQEKMGGQVEYYHAPFVAQWRKLPDRPPGERRAWLIRPRQGGHDLVDRWLKDSFVSLAASHIGEVKAGALRSEIRATVDAGYQHLDYAQRVSLANEYHAFLSQMCREDIVVTLVDDQLYLGVLDGDPEYNLTDSGARLRRQAAWSTSVPVGVDTLAAPLPAELDQQGTVVDLTGALDVLAGMVELAGIVEIEQEHTETEATMDRAQPIIRTVPTLPAVTDDLVTRLHIDRPWLQELIDLWQERSQIVLYGPPGTGKTYLARAVAAHVAARDAVRLVQFHPSYAYEDFFEGFRPVEGADSATVSFAKIPGPLREIAAEARGNPEQPYVLIVDEINRANLAKVFGELYFLLEYRQATIRLQYSPSEAFNLPPNVFIIGTMNTADRSIALVDAAIRRRFAFVELHPDEPPVRTVLSTWLTANGHPDDERAALLAALNVSIGEEDNDFKIGPSYLMKPNLDTEAALERVWRYDLLPLLEEHYYGRLTRTQIRTRFGLAAIRARARSSVTRVAASDTDPTPPQ